jgi:hypothetical protein
MTYPNKLMAAFVQHKRLHRRLSEIEEALAHPIEDQRRRELIRERETIINYIRREGT